jgi:hypothetical protein
MPSSTVGTIPVPLLNHKQSSLGNIPQLIFTGKSITKAAQKKKKKKKITFSQKSFANWHASGCPPRANFTEKKKSLFCVFFAKKGLTSRFFLSN